MPATAAVGIRAVAAWALLAAVVVAGCGAPGDELRTEGASVLLVTIDTLRADRVGAYGHRAADTPHLDRLAAGGVRFAEVVSPTPLTLPAHTSLMSSVDPPVHGVRDNARGEVAADRRLLAEVLRDAGYDTAAFVAAYVLHSRWGLARGFDRYDDDEVHGISSLVPGRLQRRGDEVVDAALAWLDRRRESPFFAWVHLYDPHAPYEPPEPYATRHADPYDGEVAWTDRQVGRLLEELAASGRLDDTLVVVTSDHGEGLGDHGEPDHGLFLYDTTILVPLIVRPAGRGGSWEGGAVRATPVGRGVVQEQVRLVDVAPTILDMVGLEAPEGFAGESVVPLVIEPGEDRPAYAETMYPRWHFGWQELYVLRSGGHKYIRAPVPELYAVVDDPGELTNLAGRAAVEDRLAADLDERIAAAGEAAPAALDPEVARQLRSLGYIGSGPAGLDEGPLPDPKEKIGLYARLVLGESHLESGRAAEAATLMEEVAAADPGIVDAHQLLGEARFELGDLEGAVEAYEAALALRPDHAAVLVALGRTHREMGRLDTARSDFQAALAVDGRDTVALYNLAEMALEAGDPATAVEHLESVIAVYDEPPGPHYALGVALYELGRLDRAARELGLVVERVPDHAEAHYHLALVAEAREDMAAAIVSYRTAVDLEPTMLPAWFNLGLAEYRQGALEGSVAAFDRALELQPDLAVAHLYRGRSLLALEDPALFREAETALMASLEPGLPATAVPEAHGLLANLYEHVGRPDEAARHRELAARAAAALR